MTPKCFIQIGSGLSKGPSWISFDSSPTLIISKIPLLGRLFMKLIKGPDWPTDTRFGDVVRGLPMQNNSCDLIFCSHMLEHLSLSDYKTALRNIFSYLSQDGVFRFIVPDLEAYARRYVERINMSDCLNTASLDFIKQSHLGCENSRVGFMRRLREAFANSRHQWLWDKFSLTNVLNEYGFRDIRFCRFGEWADARFSEVEELRCHEDSICIECRK